MTEVRYILDVTAAHFESEVIERSAEVPVLVDFWAAWCGPCKVLMPVLTRLAEAYQGRFILAKVNIDEQQELALRFGVRSVPTVKVFRFGEVVDEFLGVQPEEQIRAILDRYIERESDRRIAAARERFAAGEEEEAIDSARAALESEPDNSRARVALAEMLIAGGRFTDARALIDAMPADLRLSEQVVQLSARLDFAETSANAPSVEELERRLAARPTDSEARYQLASQRLAAGDYEAALETFLELMRRDRAYGEDAGRKGMLKVFDLVDDAELVGRFRRKMAQLMY